MGKLIMENNNNKSILKRRLLETNVIVDLSLDHSDQDDDVIVIEGSSYQEYVPPKKKSKRSKSIEPKTEAHETVVILDDDSLEPDSVKPISNQDGIVQFLPTNDPILLPDITLTAIVSQKRITPLKCPPGENGNCSDGAFPFLKEEEDDLIDNDILDEISDNKDTEPNNDSIMLSSDDELGSVSDVQPSLTNNTGIDSLTQEFFDAIEKEVRADVKPKYHKKVKILQSYFKKAPTYVNSETYREKIKLYLQRMKTESNNLVLEMFKELFLDLKNRQENKVYDKNEKILKLEAMLEKCRSILQKLEVSEVDWDEDENSCYMKSSKYQERIIRILNKIKTLKGDFPNLGLLSDRRLDFAGSKYVEINSALSKKYKDRKKIPFPDYKGVEKCVRKVVKEHDLKLNEKQIKDEAKKDFEQLGQLVKRRRVHDCKVGFNDYLDPLAVDPAIDDKELLKKLEENKKNAKKELSVLQKFVELQETGVQPECSDDSDDSNINDDSDNDD